MIQTSDEKHDAKMKNHIGNILNHVTAHDKESQAMLIAKMVDRNGPEFAKKITGKIPRIYGDLRTNHSLK